MDGWGSYRKEHLKKVMAEGPILGSEDLNVVPVLSNSTPVEELQLDIKVLTAAIYILYAKPGEGKTVTANVVARNKGNEAPSKFMIINELSEHGDWIASLTKKLGFRPGLSIESLAELLTQALEDAAPTDNKFRLDVEGIQQGTPSGPPMLVIDGLNIFCPHYSFISEKQEIIDTIGKQTIQFLINLQDIFRAKGFNCILCVKHENVASVLHHRINGGSKSQIPHCLLKGERGGEFTTRKEDKNIIDYYKGFSWTETNVIEMFGRYFDFGGNQNLENLFEAKVRSAFGWGGRRDLTIRDIHEHLIRDPQLYSVEIRNTRVSYGRSTPVYFGFRYFVRRCLIMSIPILIAYLCYWAFNYYTSNKEEK